METRETSESSKRSKVCRPCVILPGLGNNTTDYDPLVSELKAWNVDVTVVQVPRADWLRNAAGLLDANYWKGTLSPRPVLNWYLDRLRTAINAVKADTTGDGKVSLIGHSAGGWLARVYMAEVGTEDIGLLLTLGTPHLPPPRGDPGVFEQTRELLYHVENTCPGAFHAPDVKYVCIAGRYLKGSGFRAEETPPVASTGVGMLDLEGVADNEAEIEANPEQAATVVHEASPTFRERFVGAGYKQPVNQTGRQAFLLPVVARRRSATVSLVSLRFALRWEFEAGLRELKKCHESKGSSEVPLITSGFVSRGVGSKERLIMTALPL
ncbi:hypothetical protein R1flu_004080 [Riccia fluitans]|uniref:GPI inositol-deacylase n=1 Tax=Riccia fluitans TaxID=41844 RepID=A0ABD1YPT0_9MARC